MRTLLFVFFAIAVVLSAQAPSFPVVPPTGGGGGGASAWGDIGGSLSNQTDLQSALDTKMPASPTTTVTKDDSLDFAVIYSQAATAHRSIILSNLLKSLTLTNMSSLYGSPVAWAPGATVGFGLRVDVGGAYPAVSLSPDQINYSIGGNLTVPGSSTYAGGGVAVGAHVNGGSSITGLIGVKGWAGAGTSNASGVWGGNFTGDSCDQPSGYTTGVGNCRSGALAYVVAIEATNNNHNASVTRNANVTLTRAGSQRGVTDAGILAPEVVGSAAKMGYVVQAERNSAQYFARAGTVGTGNNQTSLAYHMIARDSGGTERIATLDATANGDPRIGAPSGRAVQFVDLGSGSIVALSPGSFSVGSGFVKTSAGTLSHGTIADADVPDTITLSNITQVTNRSHTNLTDTGTNTHAQIDTHIGIAATSASTLSTDLPVLGSANNRTLKSGTRTGNTTEYGTWTGTKTAGKQVTLDANGNLTNSPYDAGVTGGGGGALPIDAEVTNSTTLTVSCLSATHADCNIRDATGTIYDFLDLTDTVTIGGSATYTGFVYESGGAIVYGYNGGTATCGAGLTCTSGITAFPANTVPLWQVSVVSGALGTATSYRAPLQGRKAYTASGCVSVDDSGTTTLIDASACGGGSSVPAAGSDYAPATGGFDVASYREDFYIWNATTMTWSTAGTCSGLGVMNSENNHPGMIKLGSGTSSGNICESFPTIVTNGHGIWGTMGSTGAYTRHEHHLLFRTDATATNVAYSVGLVKGAGGSALPGSAAASLIVFRVDTNATTTCTTGATSIPANRWHFAMRHNNGSWHCIDTASDASTLDIANSTWYEPAIWSTTPGTVNFGVKVNGAAMKLYGSSSTGITTDTLKPSFIVQTQTGATKVMDIDAYSGVMRGLSR
jgi:hypothetical protein